MPTVKPSYDLTLLLDPKFEDDVRAGIVNQVESVISAEGEILSRHHWGIRSLAYEINKGDHADYYLLQFEGPPSLLAKLNHQLKITDGVTRFRIIKLKPGTPSAPDLARSSSSRPQETESAGNGYDHERDSRHA